METPNRQSPERILQAKVEELLREQQVLGGKGNGAKEFLRIEHLQLLHPDLPEFVTREMILKAIEVEKPQKSRLYSFIMGIVKPATRQVLSQQAKSADIYSEGLTVKKWSIKGSPDHGPSVVHVDLTRYEGSLAIDDRLFALKASDPVITATICMLGENGDSCGGEYNYMMSPSSGLTLHEYPPLLSDDVLFIDRGKTDRENIEAIIEQVNNIPEPSYDY